MDFYPVTAKPIFVVGLPKGSNPEIVGHNINVALRTDYHILIYNRNDNQFDFKAFYAKDLNVMDFEQFKQEIRAAAMEHNNQSWENAAQEPDPHPPRHVEIDELERLIDEMLNF